MGNFGGSELYRLIPSQGFVLIPSIEGESVLARAHAVENSKRSC